LNIGSLGIDLSLKEVSVYFY
jgi:hypothetical protein